MSRLCTVSMCCFEIFLFVAFFDGLIVLNARQTKSNIATITSWRNLITQKQFISDLLKPYANFSIINGPPKCVQMQCKIICVRTRIDELNKSIESAISSDDTNCPIIEELCLYHTEFRQQKISYGFLGEYSHKVKSLYIGTANVTDIEEGAFQLGIFREIYLEDLQLNVLRKDMFSNISKTFKTFSVIQHGMPVKRVDDDFLCNVKYQLRSLTLQIGLPEIMNITSSSSLLNNLKTVDLSNNNLTNTLTDDTFAKLWIVENLDLSHSNIEMLPIYIFSKLTDSLVYLNLSYNKLTTLSHWIFGRRNPHEKLVIEAHNNPWNCSCELRKELEQFLKQSHTDNITCQTPLPHEGLSIWDKRMCPNKLNEHLIGTTNLSEIFGIPTTKSASVVAFSALTPTNPTKPAIPEEDIILLQCFTSGSDSKVQWKKVLWSDTNIRLMVLSDFRVAVTLEFEEFERPYGVIWFSKVDNDYYSMTVNYDQYGLGCIGPINDVTIISNLLPDTTYTFCLIGQHQLTVPPFHCESVHLGTKLEIKDSDSLGRIKIIALIVLGVALCCFLGITGIFKLLQYKPKLLKGSKRVITPSRNSMDIIILPKNSSLESLRMKEDTMAKQNAESNYDFGMNSSKVHRNSVVSVEGSQSYINANLYEVIPAYLRLQGAGSQVIETSAEFEYYDESLVSYAEVSPRCKRASNDPLPALPRDQTQVSVTPPAHSVDGSLPLNGCMWSIKVSDAIL